MTGNEKFHRIAQFILSKLNNSFVFQKKLELLKLTIIEDAKYTNGGCQTDLSNGISYEILLKIKPDDPVDYQIFVMAHELYHLLFEPINVLCITDYCVTDNSFAFTNIVRLDKNNCLYGESLQEMVCDYLAVKTVNYMQRIPLNEIVNNVAGKALRKPEQYMLTDELINLVSKHKFSMKNKLDEIFYEDDKRSVANLFMYTCVTGCLSTFISNYDSCMGNGWWRILCESLDSYAKNFLPSQSKDDTKILKFIKSEFERFRLVQNKEISALLKENLPAPVCSAAALNT